MKLLPIPSTALVKPFSIGFLTLGFSLIATTVRAFEFSTIGTWGNAVGGDVAFTSGPENRASWGQYIPQSGLGFTGNAGSGSFGSTLDLGVLRHFNNAVGLISLTVPQTIDLTVALNLVIDNQAIARNFTYTLGVDETPSDLSPCPYPSQTSSCSDAVTWQNTVSSNAFTAGGREYTLELLGFSNTPGGSPINQFVSDEGSTNQTLLYGRVVETAAVPEPTTMAGLGLASLGLSYARRRLKKSA